MNIKSKFDGHYRFGVKLVFVIAYIFVAIYKIYIDPFILYSDFLEYQKHYTDANDGNFFVFGVEFFIPTIFFLFRLIGINFYDVVFVHSVFYLPVIILLSQRVNSFLLPLYFSFFLLWFVPNSSFLLRQYVSTEFLILFYLTTHWGKKNLIFLFISFFSHISAVVNYFIALLPIQKKSTYIVFAIISVASFLIQLKYDLFGALPIDALSLLLNDGGYADFDRKISGQISILNSEGWTGVSSVLNSLVLMAAVLLHSIKIYKHGEHDGLMKLFYFSSMFSLFFAGLTVLSNRGGFVGYSFSIPYLAICLSFFKVTTEYNIKFRDDAFICRN